MPRLPVLLILPLVLAACQETTPTTSAPGLEVIEVLAHHEGKFTQSEAIPAGGVGSSFAVGDTTFAITDRWPHAETIRKMTDDADKKHHAVELSWDGEDGEDTQWVYQIDSMDQAPVLEHLGAKIRVSRPGDRPPHADDSNFPGQVQFLWQGRHYDLPTSGGEVFEGWTVKSLKQYNHALMDEEGGVTDVADSSFTNRVLEVHLTDGKGSEERHIAFLDHPDVTTGIHPEILPVYRVSGEATSLSRLVVCRAVEPATEHQLVQLTPGVTGAGLTVRIWPKGEAEFTTRTVPELPAEIPLAEGVTLRLTRQFAHARPHVKWERREIPADGEAKPALVIEHRLSHHQKSEFVLIRGEVTPCRVGDLHLMLRYATEGD